MSYTRVIPRDLFNEAKLLKCLGQLSLLIHDKRPATHGLALHHYDSEFAGFCICQNPGSGALYVENIELYCEGRVIALDSPYNSKDNYPLTFACGNPISGDEATGRVFTEDGQLSPDFEAALIELKRSGKNED